MKRLDADLKPSAGFTLIEMLVVLTLLSSLLGGTIGLMSIVQNSDQKSKQNFLIRQDIRRFTNDFRHDMRSATTADISEKELLLTDGSSDFQIIYQVVSESRVSRADVRGGEPKARDEYVLGLDAKIQIESIEDSKFVRWTITESDRPASVIRILAARGAAR